MSGTAFLVLSVLFKNTLVDSPFHIPVHDEPLLFINHGDNLFQINGLVYLVLCFGINSAYQIVLLAKQFQCLFVLLDQFQSIKGNQIVPLIPSRNCRFLSEHFYILDIHLQKQKIGQLGNIISKPNTLSGKSRCQIPNLLGERLLCCVICCHNLCSFS